MTNKGCISCVHCEAIRNHYYCGNPLKAVSTRLTEKQLYNSKGYCSNFKNKNEKGYEDATKKLEGVAKRAKVAIGVFKNGLDKAEEQAKIINQNIPSGIFLENAGYNNHDGCFEKCPICGEVYNSYERLYMGLKNGEPFHCRNCNSVVKFNY